MKKRNEEFVVSSSAPRAVGKHETTSVKDDLRPVSRWDFISKPAAVIAVMVVAVGIAFVGFSYFGPVTGAHPGETSEVPAQLGSPAFANPSEIRYRAGEPIGRLRGIMEMTAGNYTIPNVGTATLRQLRGWDPKQPAPPKTEIGPGPTLRARARRPGGDFVLQQD